MTVPTGRAERARFTIGLFSLMGVTALLCLLIWAVVVPLALGWSSVAVLSGSMEPGIEAGDIVVTSPHDGAGLGPGTVIVFRNPAGSGKITHRIVAVDPSGHYVTKGDRNPRIDSDLVAPSQVFGVGRLLVPFVGKPYQWVNEGHWPALALTGIVLLAALWSSRWATLRRYDPWRDEEEEAEDHPAPTRRPVTVTRADYVALIVASLLVANITGVGSHAAFAATTATAGNSWTADVLAAPTGVSATGGADITLDWTATTDTYATGHRVYRATSSGGPYSQVAQVTPRTTETYVDDPIDGAYYYVLRAYYLNWESANSSEVSATKVTPEDYDAVAPASDNCPVFFNPLQFDTDGDATGDACDSSPTASSTGTFTSDQALSTDRGEGVAVGDVDGDGDLDAVFASFNDTNRLWLNNGSGTFTSDQGLGSAFSEGVSFGDLDGDGDLDVVFANGFTGNTVWTNDGSGNFTDTGQSLGSERSRKVALGDVDGDGDLDAVFANDADTNRLWLNNGSGTFTSDQGLGSVSSGGVAFGDVDGDLDIDVIFANDNSGNTVWTNDGSGSFTDTGQSLGSARSRHVAVGDVDGDGDLDAVFANDADTNRLWLNNGSGTFTSDQGLGVSNSFGVAIGDLDGDGDLDVIFANDNSGNTVWTNDGSGSFTDTGQSLGSARSQSVAAGDVDGDGDLDAVFANGSDTSRLWLNS